MSRTTTVDAPRARRPDGWGYVGEAMAPSAEMLAWLAARLGSGEGAAGYPAGGTPALPPSRPLPALPGDVRDDDGERFAHARGRGLSDLLRLRSGRLPAAPDAVAHPASAAEVEALLAACSAGDVRVIPWGGGTSVTGGVNPEPGERPTLTVDLGGLAGLLDLDEASELATFGAGTLGPAVEAALAPHGLTLGHFPQSFEHSTLGGWIVTHSAGQESLGVGRIADLVAGLELVAPGGRLELPAMPASAAGPDLRQLVVGSEGRFGVVTRATVRVRRRPETERVEAALLHDWETGVEAARELVRADIGLSLLRLSDEPETAVAMATGLGRSRFAPLVRGYLRLRGLGGGGCLLLLGAGGSAAAVDQAFEASRLVLRPFGGAWLGAGPGRHWRRDRFRHPYLRDALLDRGIATDTFETAAPWSRLPALYAAVRGAFAAAAVGEEREVPVLCHLSHPYRDGASLYFTFFFRCPPEADAAVERWAGLKRQASEAVADAGGTLSHHHGVGAWHAPWLEREVGGDGARVLAAVARELDPAGVLNPGVLLDPTDRLAL